MFREILKNKIKTSNGHFDVSCQEAHVTPAIQGFISTLLRGLSAENTYDYYKQAAVTVGQMIAFNTTICSEKASTISYHSFQEEPPLPIYLAMMMHNKTRNFDLIKKYRLCNISVSLGNALLLINEK